MQINLISHSFERRLLHSLLSAQVGAVLANLLLLGREAGLLPRVVTLVSAVLLGLTGLAVLFLFLRYIRHPAVRAERQLQAAAPALRERVSALEARLARLIEEQAALSQAVDEQADLRRAAYDWQAGQFAARRAQIDADEQAALAEALAGMQAAYREARLHQTALAQARAVGVGPGLRQRLESRGIRSAAGLTRAALAGIPGVGEKKRAALLDWRAALEQALHQEQPAGLPPALARSIAAPYAVQRSRLEALAAHNEAAWRKDTAQIRGLTAGRQAVLETEARELTEQILQANREYHQASAALQDPEALSFWEYLYACLQERPSDRGWMAAAMLLAPLALLLVFALQRGLLPGG